MTDAFKDHFSRQSDDYARYRPTYPPELFQFLSSLTNDHSTALDCATGSGQAALGLCEFYSEVIATDASQSQIDAAVRHPQVSYHVAAAERSGLDDHRVDLIAVGQAFHWFDETAFLIEAQRVLKADGVLAIWCYALCRVDESCDAIVDHLYRDIVGSFWPPERVMIEKGYNDVRMPGATIDAPPMEMSLSWSAEDMLGYLRTWSACKRYEQQHELDPVAGIAAELSSAWGDEQRRVVWPLAIRVSRLNTLLE